MSVQVDYLSVTELAGDQVTSEQIERLCHRYYWASQFTQGKDVVEIACGTGQGLGYLHKHSKSVEGADISEKMVNIAIKHYKNRIKICHCNALSMPYSDQSKDVIILFEAIYYLSDVDQFIKECKRVLRSNGTILIASANKDLYDFNPSPHSNKYYGADELSRVFLVHGLRSKCYGYMPIEEISLKQKLLRPVKKLMINIGIMPKTMAGKKLLKRLVFGRMTKMPDEIEESMMEYRPPSVVSSHKPDRSFKVLYWAADKISIKDQ